LKETTLVIIRHGETVWNLEKRIQGHLDSQLSKLGRQQTSALEQVFRSRKIDALYTSDLGRAVKTAAALERATGIQAIKKTCLRESNLGIMQGKTKDELSQDIPDEYDLFRERDPDYVIPEGESLNMRHQRVVSCLNEIADNHQGQVIAIVCHGGVLDSLFRYVNAIPLAAPRTFSIFNASISTVTISNGRWLLATWCDVSHL
jgi:probable phosphoglycerate mutase